MGGAVMSEIFRPKHPVRLERVFAAAPTYFLTMCTESRVRVLACDDVADRMRVFAEGSLSRYGVFVNAWLLMPDHLHLLVSFSVSTDTTLGMWVKAMKRFVAAREFKWQRGYFDHVLRSDESRSQKWEYICMNPVRAGLVDAPEEWSFCEFYHSVTGEEL
jgi:putative transposase